MYIIMIDKYVNDNWYTWCPTISAQFTMIGLFKTYFDEETKIGGGGAITDIKKGTLVSPQGEIMI